MICRRGGIDKNDIGAIKISDTTTEFEISERVAESFAANVRRPDKEDNIRIDRLDAAPQAQAPSHKRPHPPRREADDTDQRPRRNDHSRDQTAPQQRGKPQHDGGAKSGYEPGFGKPKKHGKKFEQARKPQSAHASPGKPGYGKKPKKKPHR